MNDFVEIDFTLKDDEGSVVETTLPQVAKDNGFFDDKFDYKPLIVILGSNSVVPGLEEALSGVKAGESKQFSLTPEKAFGPREAELVKLISLGKFKEQGLNPTVGMVMDFDGVPGKITSVDSGRVKVDFNNPLAGKNISYEVKVLNVYSTPDAKAKGLVANAFKGQEVSVTVNADKAVVSASSKVVKDSNFITKKLRVMQVLLQYAGFKLIQFVEDYALPQEHDHDDHAGHNH
ncbi:peptidylprolyl isomerase [Candidatus Micrarchaeota archaeon]|nr:peptidylprolyl isomerase [Candidatus Micrarchaeota archaeon]